MESSRTGRARGQYCMLSVSCQELQTGPREMTPQLRAIATPAKDQDSVACSFCNSNCIRFNTRFWPHEYSIHGRQRQKQAKIKTHTKNKAKKNKEREKERERERKEGKKERKKKERRKKESQNNQACSLKAWHVERGRLEFKTTCKTCLHHPEGFKTSLHYIERYLWRKRGFLSVIQLEQTEEQILVPLIFYYPEFSYSKFSWSIMIIKL